MYAASFVETVVRAQIHTRYICTPASVVDCRHLLTLAEYAQSPRAAKLSCSLVRHTHDSS